MNDYLKYLNLVLKKESINFNIENKLTRDAFRPGWTEKSQLLMWIDQTLAAKSEAGFSWIGPS